MGGYWVAAHEMFARAFETHVQDKLKSQGRLNTYLVYGCHADPLTGANPYPDGEERTRVNEAMGRLMKVAAEYEVLHKAMIAHGILAPSNASPYRFVVSL